MIIKPPIFQTISPPFDQISAPVLRYPALKEIVMKYYRKEYENLDNTLIHLEDTKSLDDSQLTQRYLLAIALKIQEATSDAQRALWTERFTNVSIQLFGRPDPNEAARIARADLRLLRQVAQHTTVDPTVLTPLFDAYEQLIRQQSTATNAPSRYTSLLTRLHTYLLKKFSSVYAILDEYKESEVVTSAVVRKRYTDMLVRLTTLDPAWRDWRVEANESAQMAVTPSDKVIQVGWYLPPLSIRRVKSLFTHEVLVHAQRSVRGLSYDTNLAYGLPGYMAAEEGLGVLMEGAIEGKMPYRIRDRYIDITLALGYGDQAPITRRQLFSIAHARALLRRANEGVLVDLTLATNASWQHVNRIYRGTLGNEIIGVFTKDIIYYRGYQQMAHYLDKYSDENLQKSIDFVLSGKMNPDDLAHRSYVHDRKFNIIRPKTV